MIKNDNFVSTSIHPESKRTAKARETRRRDLYAMATAKERVGMFNPDARTKGK